MRIKTGEQHQGWTVVHQARREWRGSFEGVWLGVEESTGHWIVGRQHDGQSMDDGFDADGNWSTSRHFAASRWGRLLWWSQSASYS